MTVAQNVDLIEAEDRRKTKEIVDKINAQVGLNEFLNDQTFSSPIMLNFSDRRSILRSTVCGGGHGVPPTQNHCRRSLVPKL